MTDPGFSEMFDLATVGDEEVHRVLRPSTCERASIAEWLGAIAVEAFEANITLLRQGADLYRYEAHFAADIVQACVVTLEPVHSRLEEDFHRLYAVIGSHVPRGRDRPTGGGVMSLSDEEGPEPIGSTAIDLAAPVLEELSLALPAYPRALGARFESPEKGESAVDRPFAALETLRAKLRPGAKSEPGEGELKDIPSGYDDPDG
jgi:uncharacterized metal-binding protein YceD (DUF177 family)